MNAPEVLAVADDLTGALEAGAKFSERGLTAAVLTGYEDKATPPGSVALVFDTETRHVSPQQARERIAALQNEFARWPDAIRYKKTDSTLRGNICSELQALAFLHPARSIIYCPAYPAMGRTVRSGRVYIDGIPLSSTPFRGDLLNPVTSSSVASLFRTDGGLPLHNVTPRALRLGPEPSLYICDGLSDDDVEVAARFIVANRSQVIAAGPAALAEALAALISQRDKYSEWPPIHSCLIVSGSRHPVSEAQLAWAEFNGFSRIVHTETDRISSRPQWTIFRFESVSDGLDRAAALGKQLLSIARHHSADAILIFGGDTTYGLIAALGRPILYAVGEPITGVALTRIAAADLIPVLPERHRDLYLLTKAGGFGASDIITRLQQALKP
jgi:D-threonate/D-erythronate kinase